MPMIVGGVAVFAAWFYGIADADDAARRWPGGQLFQRAKSGVEEDSFAAELVYSGKFGDDTVRFLYREYVDDMARPAFTQELSYDLPESNPISFKSLVIDVQEATNNSITVSIVEDGGLPWLP